MSQTCRAFTRYKIWYLGHGETAAEIHCYNHASYVGKISFCRDQLKIEHKADSGDEIHITFRLDELANILYLLENISPLYLHWNPVAKTGCLSNAASLTNNGMKP